MRKAILYSLVLHLGIFLFLYFDFRLPFFNKIDLSNSMVIDFVNIAEKSAAPKKSLAPLPSEQVKEDSKEKEESKLVEEKKQPEKPKEPENPKEEVKKEEHKKEKDKKDDVILKKDKEEPKKEQKKEEPKKVEKKKPKKAELDLKESKPKGKKPDAKKDKAKDNKKHLDDVLSDLEKNSKDSIDELLDAEDGENAEEIAPVVTASEIDAVRRKIYPCWSVPAGAKDAKNLIVEIDMELSQDGTVIKADIVDKRRLKNDQYFRVAAESAHRAVLDPRCQPLPFPKGKHDQWKSVTMTFNPKDMF